jgi:hypothetical protein
MTPAQAYQAHHELPRLFLVRGHLRLVLSGP